MSNKLSPVSQRPEMSLYETNAQARLTEIRSQQGKKIAPVENSKSEKENTDSVKISSESKLLAAAYEKLKQTSPEREDKVAQIKKEIDSKQYEIDYAAIAKKIHPSLLKL